MGHSEQSKLDANKCGWREAEKTVFERVGRIDFDSTSNWMTK